jgi:carbon monoxide dehydrogenase subunit G
MELKDEFEVSLPVAEAWAVLTDLEKFVPCVPGAELREVEGDELRGVLKVRVGPITVSYRGSARFESLDADAHRAVLKAEGREVRGQGNATAVITATLSPSAGGTRVRVVTNLTVSGKLAQFDRGEVAEASGKLAAEFARNLESTVLEAPGAATPEAATPEPVVEAPAEAEIDAEVASYAAELKAEVVLDEIDAEVAADGAKAAAEAVSYVAGSDDATGGRETYLSTEEPEEERESLLKRLTPYLTVAGFLLIARIVVYSLRRRRR